MANWETGATSSTFNADNSINKAQAVRKYNFKGNAFSGRVYGGESFDFDFSDWKKGYNVVGLDASKITSSVIPAFEKYIKAINDKIDDMKVTASKMNAAFKGTELQNAVKQYVNKMERYLVNFTTQLRAFEDKLMDVKNAWDKAQAKQGQTISKTASSFAEIGEYKRQITK